MKIIFATGNKDKVKEIREIFRDTEFDVITMKEAGFDGDIIEDGETFEENSFIKAKAVWDWMHKIDHADVKDAIVMADDSGFVVDALGGRPGVYSARYLGADADYNTKCGGILKELEELGKTKPEDRTARFVAAITAILPDGRKLSTRGTIEGVVFYKMQGENGFGYDPIHYVPELKKTTAEITMEEKNEISHRGKALRLMREELLAVLGK